MANLTGDFDVIAQFAVPAVNRVLAAMHRVERFPHSISVRVDDTPQPTHGWRPTVIGVKDVFGDAPADHTSIRDPRLLNIGDFLPGSSGARVAAALGAVANLEVVGIHLPPIEPSNIKGKAQVQLFPPTIELSDPSGQTVTVEMELIARYLPDEGTSPVAEYVRGKLRITAPINRVVTQSGNMVYVDVRGPSTEISFTPSWSSVPIGLQDMLGINLLIKNALRTSFLPSSSELDSKAGHVQFKPMSGTPGSVAMLLNMDPLAAAGNPVTASQSFLSGGDEFSVGISADFMRAAFEQSLGEIVQTQIPDATHRFGTSWLGYRVTYKFTLLSATLEFENGKMVLVIVGHASTDSFLPSFNFTVKQDMTLRTTGDSAELKFGEVHVSANKTLVNAAMWFLGSGSDRVAAARDDALTKYDTQQKVRDKLSAEANFGAMLRSLMTPASGGADLPPLDVTLAYTSADIRATGIILHGSVTVPAAPPPRVEYEPIASTPNTNAGGHPLPTDIFGSVQAYSALKSWVPGGTVDRYEWHRQGAQGHIEQNRFVHFQSTLPSAVSTAIASSLPVTGYSPMCLTVHGNRLSTSGPVVSETVTATVCGYRSFPIHDIPTSVLSSLIALARRGSGGMVEVVGHALPTSRSDEDHAPNLIIHFADEVSGEKLGDLVTALDESKRSDAPTAILVAVKGSRLERLPFSESVTYVEDDAQLRKHYGVATSGAFTVVVDPSGKVVWKGEGQVDVRQLAPSLGKVLVKATPPKASLLSASARIGQRAPDFLFDAGEGHALTLSKVRKRRVVLVFFNRASRPSIEAVRDAVAAKEPRTQVLAISDGEGDASSSSELSPAIVVPDRQRQIAAAYGVTMWPTIVSIDESGIVRSISYGRHTTGEKSRA